MTLITLCICTYNRYALLPNAIESATRQTLRSDQFAIQIIDNNPDTARAEKFALRYASVPNLTYTLERAAGLSNARNVAVRLATTPLIAFMDDDAVASPDWSAELVQAFEEFGASAEVVGGRVEPIWSQPRPSWLANELLGSLSVVNWGGATRVASEVEWLAGTNIAFRVEALRRHGGFATRLGRIGSGAALISNEELELLNRIRAAGGSIIYAPNARVDHLVDAQRLNKSWFRKRMAWQALSDFLTAPDQQAINARLQWSELLDYFNRLPPHERTLRGLAFETDDPELIKRQIGVHYTLTMLLLTGLDGTQLD